MPKAAVDWVRAKAGLIALVNGILLIAVQLGKVDQDFADAMKTHLGQAGELLLGAMTIFAVVSKDAKTLWNSFFGKKDAVAK